MTIIALRVVLVATLIAVLVTVPDHPLWGDGVEYAATLMAWINHGTPALRAEDIAAVSSPLHLLGFDGVHADNVVIAPDGTRYAAHFWLYSLVSAPAALLLRTLGGDPLIALALINAVAFAGFLAAACWSRRLSPRDRAMIALAAVSPVILYLRFPHPEAFTWACVLAALLAMNHARYGLGALGAACGAMQYPPVASLAAFCVVLARRDRGWRGALAPAAAALLSLTPLLFFALTVGNPTPLAKPGFVDWRHATPARLWSMLTDLNQGLLPYVPGLLLLAALRLRHATNARHLGVLCVLVSFMAGAAVSENWSSSMAGLMRYAVWVVPLLAWLATEPEAALRGYTIAVVVALHAALLLTPIPPVQGHSRLAEYALAHWPRWYRPDPEIFGERTTRSEWVWRALLPLGFTRADGSVSLLLLDAPALPQLSRVFITDPAYVQELTTTRRSGVFYLVPPPGAVRSRCDGDIQTAVASLRALTVQAVGLEHATDRRVAYTVQLTHHGNHALCNLGTGGRHAFNLVAGVVSAGGPQTALERTRGPQILLPGDSLRHTVFNALPSASGRYVVEVLPMIDDVAWGEQAARFVVDVANTGGNYRVAQVTEPRR